jgi:hypothetical protein
MEKMIGFGIGFFISLVFGILFVWSERHLFSFPDTTIIIGLVIMYSMSGGFSFNKS